MVGRIPIIIGCGAVILGFLRLFTLDKMLNEFRYSVHLNDETYDIVTVYSPAAMGWQLKFLVNFIAFDSANLGTPLARLLLQANGMYKLRELASQLRNEGADSSGKEYGLSAPIVRVSPNATQWHKEAASQKLIDAWETPSSLKQSYRTVEDFHNAYLSKKVTPSQVLEHILEQGKVLNEKLRFVQELAVSAGEEAAKSSERWMKGEQLGVWDGIPILVKAEFAVRGLKHTAGMKTIDGDKYIAKDDDLIVARFRNAGAIILGTSIMHEFGVSPLGFNHWYQGPYNPYDASRFTGGSSSGSAVAVAAGLVPVALGTDGGGSIRIPAGWCGCVGLAPSFGRVPFNKTGVEMYNVVKPGPITASVKDAALAHLLLAQGLDEAEGKALHPYATAYGGEGPPPPHLLPRFHERPIRVGIWREYNSHSFYGREKQGKDIDRSLEWVLEKLGNDAQVGEYKIPNMRTQALAHGVIISSDFSLAHDLEFAKAIRRERNDTLEYATLIQLRLGYAVSALDRLAAERVRAWAMKKWRSVLEKYDVIITPTLPTTALPMPEGIKSEGLLDLTTSMQMLRYVWPANLLGLPGLAVPVGYDSNEMPLSLQVICTHWHEADCLAVGQKIEAAVEGDASRRRRRPVGHWMDSLDV